MISGTLANVTIDAKEDSAMQSWIRLAVTITMLFHVDVARAAPIAEKPQSPCWILPWGIVDSAGKTGYVANAKGGIDALDLATGKLLWTYADANRPLTLSGNKLLAQIGEKGKANVIRIAFLNTANKGKRILLSDAVVFPQWVTTGLTHGRSFAAQGFVDKENLYLRWIARAWYAGGARPTPEIEKAARKNADGVVRVNLKTGKVTMLAANKAPKPPAPKIPAAVANAAFTRVYTAFGEETWVTTNGKQAVVVAMESKPGGQQAVLKRWDLTSGKALENIPLLFAPSLQIELSADGRHSLIRNTLPRPGGGQNDWLVYSTETGKQVGKFAHEEGTFQVSAIGDRVFYVVNKRQKGAPRFSMDQDRTLKAVNWKTGKDLWECALEPQKVLLPLP
jgi:outer membrane protein assembly factor BamB